MKARVKATGEIVEVDLPFISASKEIVYDRVGSFQVYAQDELDFDVQGENIIDYWEKLLHQYVGMAMQGMIRRSYEAYCDDCANYENMIFEDAQALLKDHAEALADVCVEFAHALIQKLKEKEERK